ncbi:MAG: GNAT family N-acetyltransferase [Hylemonella sp.]
MNKKSEQDGRLGKTDYVIRLLDSPLKIEAADWNQLLAMQAEPTPFMRHEYLSALHLSGSATPATGWTPCFVTLWQGNRLAAACPMYFKTHSYGEYVFDWAWASAYQRHGLAYYPKALVAVPFTPVAGSRLLAIDAASRSALVAALIEICQHQQVSSLHLLFASEEDLAPCRQAGLSLRHTVQFHWNNAATPYQDYEDFLRHLAQDKRKKIRQEQRKVKDAGVHHRWVHGRNISSDDWDFFYRCYSQTYAEHGNPPYLQQDFFLHHMAQNMPDAWLMFIAERAGHPIACSLVALDPARRIAYGRYWGALERVDCLHFDLCYYQPIQWCIAQGMARFEGGAQGEHKLSRALLPVRSSSAHWMANPAFAQAVERALDQEQSAIGDYLAELDQHSPFKRVP